MSTSIIDISSDNGKIDFKRVFDAMTPDPVDGEKRVIIRTSKGCGDVDVSHLTYALQAKEAGFMVSYYHFAYPDNHSGGTIQADSFAEADYFCNIIKKMPDCENLIIDLEQNTQLTKVQFSEWLTEFIEHVYARTGKMCYIYTYKDYLDEHLPDGHNFGKYPLWIANYSVSDNPPIPKGFKTWALWQYTETGRVDGIDTNVDFSTFNRSNL